MKVPKYKNSEEYREQFKDLDNVCFLPHERYRIGMRERHVVQYPLARMIARGDLSKKRIFPTFLPGSTLVLCNLRPKVNAKRNVRPDILAFSANADILMIECKIKGKNEDWPRAINRLVKAAEQLVGYAQRLKRFARKSVKNPVDTWSQLHYAVYTKIHEFPCFGLYLSDALTLKTSQQQETWIKKINLSLSRGKIKYGLAFNAQPDRAIPGYQGISISCLRKEIKGIWGHELGHLLLFSVDHKKDDFSILGRV
jgi:hypothetical protein